MPGAWGSQKCVLDSLEQELGPLVNHRVGVRNQIWVLWQSSQGSKPPGHLRSPNLPLLPPDWEYIQAKGLGLDRTQPAGSSVTLFSAQGRRDGERVRTEPWHWRPYTSASHIYFQQRLRFREGRTAVEVTQATRAHAAHVSESRTRPACALHGEEGAGCPFTATIDICLPCP